MTADMLDEAKRMQALGLSVIPIGRDKRPAVRWKRYQTEAADERQLWDWWASRDDLGIAIVLGEVSQHVCGRDFDDPESFNDWMTRHRALARELPITLARRGGHVYYRNPISETMKLTDGEIRSNGNYLIVPPSLHPSGIHYTWLNPFVRLPQFVDPVEEGLRPEPTAKANSQQPKPAAEDSSGTALGNRIGVPLETAVANAIRASLPKRVGERNDLIFEFARRLKAVPELRSRSGEDVLPFAHDWFRAALPTIGTKQWRVTRDAFLSAWPRITHPFTDGTLTACLADVDSSIPSPIALRYLDDPVAMRLVGLCERLQRIAGSEPFFLSTDACGLFGLNHKMQLHRRLMRLMADGVLKRVSVGNSYSGLSSEYLYLPSPNLASLSAED